MRISDWSSDVCSSDLLQAGNGRFTRGVATALGSITNQVPPSSDQRSRRGEKTMNNTMSPVLSFVGNSAGSASMNRPGASSTDSGSWYEAMSKRSEEHTSELQSLMRISYAVFCLKQKKKYQKNDT